MTDPLSIREQVRWATRLLAVDPNGLGGIWIRARMRPTGLLRDLGPMRRITPNTSDEVLYGGLDLTSTLAAGRPVRSEGLLKHQSSRLCLSMAERAGRRLTARLSMALDQGRGPAIIALDEGIDDERLDPGLADRLAFHLDLNDLHGTKEDPPADMTGIEDAAMRLADVHAPDEILRQTVMLAGHLGIDSLRTPVLAIRAARAAAALAGRKSISEEDMTLAATLVLAPRALVLPGDEMPEQAETSKPEDNPAEQSRKQENDVPEDLLLEAVKAALPPGFLDQMVARNRVRAAKGARGAGAQKVGNRRGRPLPPRPGRLDASSRIDLIATLRQAAPWQTLRRQQTPDHPARVLIRPDDIRLKRFEEKSDRVLIFAVDASGSTALARLAEAKGAIELLLAEAYARRDHVALIAFRGAGAEILLPPTRSLVQAKRRLGSLPGGGGTPLAAGLEAAGRLAELVRSRGATPSVVLLTDGKANITHDGNADRPLAAQDAERFAKLLTQLDLPLAVIDTGNRPQPQAAQLARTLRAQYLPLPRADAYTMSRAVSEALQS